MGLFLLSLVKTYKMECKHNQKVTAVYLVNRKDWHYKNGIIDKLKRPYGKYNRKNAIKRIK